MTPQVINHPKHRGHVAARIERMVNLSCGSCGSVVQAMSPVDDSPAGISNRRGALALHLLDSPACERRSPARATA